MKRSPLNLISVCDRLVGPGLPLQRIDIVASTGSTNADLIARHTAGEDIRGTVLLAEYQSAGRGRNGRIWTAPPHSHIALSLGVDVGSIIPQHWGWLPLLTGVALADAVRTTTGIDAGVKWPNDVMVGTGKLAGVLTEVISPDSVAVVGLGLNVTLTPQEAPDVRAVSLYTLGAEILDRDVLVGAILHKLVTRIQRWQSTGGADPTLAEDYRLYSLTLGTQVRATLLDGCTITGVAVDIDSVGQLRINTGQNIVTVSAGDITHLRA